MRVFVVALSLTLATSYSFSGAAQAAVDPVPGVQQVRMLGSGTGRCVQQTADGGCLLTGWTKGQPDTGSSIFLIKMDELGNKDWETLLDGNGFSCGYGVSQTRDGGAVVVGDTKAQTGSDHDVFVAKVDAGGNKVWEKNFGGPYCDYGAAVIQTSDGGYLVAGGTESYGAGLYDVYLLRLDALGCETWEYTYGGKGSDCGYALMQTPDGGYAVAGNTDSTGSGKVNIYLLKTDAGGNLLWSKNYGGMNDSYGWSLQPAGNGGCIIAGETAVAGASGGGFKSYLVRTDKLGNKTWERIYSGDSYGAAYAAWQAGDGSYLLAGKKEMPGGVHSLCITKTDSRGNVVWERTQADLGGSCAYSGMQTGDGGCIVAGEGGLGADGTQQVLLLKLAPDRSAALQMQLVVLMALAPLLLLVMLLMCSKKKYAL